jgi:hypothetical protein
MVRGSGGQVGDKKRKSTMNRAEAHLRPEMPHQAAYSLGDPLTDSGENAGQHRREAARRA